MESNLNSEIFNIFSKGIMCEQHKKKKAKNEESILEESFNLSIHDFFNFLIFVEKVSQFKEQKYLNLW